MIVKSAKFIKSIVNLLEAPRDGFHEYAFIGRSNVGKSSLINMLTGFSTLAKTSTKPGKTQTINYFMVNEEWYMVDLPGYGWAKVSKKKKEDWNKMVNSYLKQREELSILFVLIDCRLEPQRIDIDFINQAGRQKIPLSIVFTKSDKLSKNHLKSNVNTFSNVLNETWTVLPPVFITSAQDGRGKSEILNYIDSINKNII